MATFVIVHGAWGGGFSWAKIRRMLAARGHEVFTPTLTGLGERAHLASPAVDLETHIQDVVATIETEDLRDVVLLGHSYGGMVVTGAADRVAERLAHLAYLDAFVPGDGDSVMSLQPAANAQAMKDRLVDGWRLTPNPLAADTPADQRDWLAARRKDQPYATFTRPVRLTGAARGVPRTYIYCLQKYPGDTFGPFAAKARSEAGWRYREIDATHTPNVTAPEALLKLILEMTS
ncbi:MAG TPA: alpha/beta hydrolase [Geminicoccaceae bacterium]|nr:alpha/beta hydrolase [Geminicoccus sp.]HMU52750.1 alpha/beta hydrolase [Geminicoccaceae bacterium]